jgi:hypothetical protein
MDLRPVAASESDHDGIAAHAFRDFIRVAAKKV